MFNFSQSPGGRKIGNIWTNGGTITQKYDRVPLSELFPDRNKRTIYTHAMKDGEQLFFAHFKDPRIQGQNYYDIRTTAPVKAYRKTTTNYDTFFILWDFGIIEPVQGFEREKTTSQYWSTSTPYSTRLFILDATVQRYFGTQTQTSFKNIRSSFLLPVFHVYGMSYITRTKKSSIETPQALPDFVNNLTNFQNSDILKYMEYRDYSMTEYGNDRNNLQIMIQQMIDNGELEELKHDHIEIEKDITLVRRTGTSSTTNYNFWGFNYFKNYNNIKDYENIGSITTYKETTVPTTQELNSYYSNILTDYTILGTDYSFYSNYLYSHRHPGPLATGYQKEHWDLANISKNDTYIQNTLFTLYPKMTRLKTMINEPLDI